MKLNFVKANPTENMTIFVMDPVPRSMYIDISKKIMDYNHIHAEQVGFIEKPSEENAEVCVRLHMMGGEFCGNAARALAAVMVHQGNAKLRSEGKTHIVPLEISGAEDILNCEVIEKDGSYNTTVKMPLHRAIQHTVVIYKGKEIQANWVQFEGIMHLIVDSRQIDSKEEFFNLVKDSLKDNEYDAFGIMFYDERERFITPLVYVRPTDSTVWERGCGSGTAAVGIYAAYKLNQGIDLDVKQPGGSMGIKAEWKNHEVVAVYLTGDVTIVAEGTLYV